MIDPDLLALVVYRNGKLQKEMYPDPANKSVPLHIRSCTKSVSSLVIGLLSDRKLIDINEEIGKYIDPHRIKNPPIAHIKVKELLTMTSGIVFPDDYAEFLSYLPVENKFYEKKYPRSTTSLLEILFAQPIKDKKFVYRDLPLQILSEIAALQIKKHLKQTQTQFVDEELFKKLGISRAEYEWKTTENNNLIFSVDLKMTALAFAKIAELIRNQGKLNGKQIVSENWVKQSTSIYVNDVSPYPPDYRYGLGWWLRSVKLKGKTYDAVQTLGYGGQRLLIVPALQSTVVILYKYLWDMPLDEQDKRAEENRGKSNTLALEQLEKLL